MLGLVYISRVVEKAAQENNLASGCILLDAPRQVDAVLLRHTDIQQRNVRLTAGAAQIVQQPAGVRKVGNLCGGTIECCLDALYDFFAVKCVVVTNNNFQHKWRSSLSRCPV